MSEKNIKIYIEDILESISKIEEYTDHVEENEFSENSKLQDAVIRRIEIIGEASGNIPKEIQKKYLDIPWKDIIGMRNILIHHYGGVDLTRIWKVVKNRIPQLKENILRVKKKEFK